MNTADNAQRISWKAWDGAIITQGYKTATMGTTANRNIYFLGTCGNAGDVITQTMFEIERF